MSGLSLSARIVLEVLRRSQNSAYRGCGMYADRAAAEMGPGATFPQAESEAADVASFFRFFSQYLVKDALSNASVLDFGSGYGGRTVEYKLSGARYVVGVEPFNGMVADARAYAAQRGVSGVEFKVCEQHRLPFPDATFDIVISYDVLEHVADPRTAIAEIYRVLRPGGLSFNVFPVYFGARSHHLDYVSNLPGLHWLFSPHALVHAVNAMLVERGQFHAVQPAPSRAFDDSRDVLPQLNGLSSWHLEELFAAFEIVSLERHPLSWWEPGKGRLAKAIARSAAPLMVRDAATSSIASVLRKPGPSPVALPSTQYTATVSLTLLDWSATQPARLTGRGVRVKGTAAAGQAYLATSPGYRLPGGGRVCAVGVVNTGGLTLGLLDEEGRFAAQTAADVGRFRMLVDAPADGVYRIVIATNTARGHRLDMQVDDVGLVDLDPIACRVRSDITAIQPLESDAWDTIDAPAIKTTTGIRIAGRPSSGAASAARSALYLLPQGAIVAATGVVREGGISLGLLDVNDQWIDTVRIGEGPFRNGIEVQAEVTCRIAVVNSLGTRTRNDVAIEEIGLVGRNPADYRVGPPAIAAISILRADDWEEVPGSTRYAETSLHICGEPRGHLEYAAVSVPLQLPRGALVGMSGAAVEGRVMLGLLENHHQTWAATTWAADRTFRTGLAAPAAGEYRIIIAPDFSGGHKRCDVTVHEVGLVGLAPSACRSETAQAFRPDQPRGWRATARELRRLLRLPRRR